MKAWELFHPFVVPDVMGCPNPLVDHALRQAAREFCQRSSVWREWADSFTATGLLQRFDFDLPGQAELVAATRATVAGKGIQVLGSHFLPADWQLTDTTFTSDALIHISMTEYMLYPMPSAGEVVSIEMALKPSLTASGVGDDVYNKWAEVVSKGALYRLLSSPGKPYTDLQAAALSKSVFESGVHAAANDQWRQTAANGRRVKKAAL